jgi:hypothetical protein
MSLGNMGEHGEGDLRSLQAREASISVDNLPGDTYVPDVALRLLCSACGSNRIMPAYTRCHVRFRPDR